MADASSPSKWQQQMRMRALKLLGGAGPLLVGSFFISSMIPHGDQEKEILVRPWGDALLVKGRMEVPHRKTEELQAAIVIEGPLPLPKETSMEVRVKSLDGSFDSKKRWRFRPQKRPRGKAQSKEVEPTWSAVYPIRLPSGEVLAYRLKTETAAPEMTAAKVHVIIDPSRSVDKYLRMGEMLFYPSLSLVILGMAMLLFAKFAV